MTQATKYLYIPKGGLHAMAKVKGLSIRGSPTYSKSISSKSLIGKKKELTQMGRCASFISFCNPVERIERIGW